jgi:hypothetical protein
MVVVVVVDGFLNAVKEATRARDPDLLRAWAAYITHASRK